jgi:uncharacterized membrane protein YhaH (DUF805 family)
VTNPGQHDQSTPETPYAATGQNNVFLDYYIGVLKKYAVFNGRARRKEYWFFSLFSFLISIGLAIIDDSFGANSYERYGPLQTLYSFAIFLPALGVTIRRMHDADKSGWFCLIPIYNIILLFTEGTRGPNRFGPDPKQN